ncbi:acyl-CoA dehydrogenase [Caulobacter sp. Root655]|uniref:acyl-CoA dehydrogenase n=1 Tax=Caulobacter sp. Root655 TaxID=1736578 RepID=UPI0006F47A46|nr:acyl-CoA dehydrogenase [Caulobacter sp. Root655]KRA61658.1 acyl-CoA dehydrogenase [Caulobacter sp. Root655]
MTSFNLRRDLITRPILQWARGVMPALSQTEREALDAGDTWWDAALFTGDPDWNQLLAFPKATLRPDEQAFIDGAVNTLCAMVDDWQMTWETRDLSPETWAYLKDQKFFGMIIPQRYGGLGFSAFGHAEVVRKIATRSASAAVTAMVPNSLGPGELILKFGTKAQQDHWLPRLADGREIPAFGLTSPEAGSDASAMVDEGVVCYGTWQGKDVLGIRLNWHKRYITLGPVCTVLGLAFKLYDPDHLLGAVEDIGITCALVPTDTPGVEIGRRHLPAFQTFQNGPNWGKDVFIPMDLVIGGAERVGQGWKMLMTALGAGRGISLPAMSGAAAAFSALTTGAYARVRSQFHVPIGKFEGVQERLARIAGNAYLLDGARRLTCTGLDFGHHPSVISALLKSGATERMRVVINDAMDVHGGKAVIEGPRNYMGSQYRAIPVGITVEGANILTRSLMVFGQGAIRAHPYMLSEILAIGDEDRAQGLADFDAVFWKHVAHAIRTGLRAWGRSWTNGAISPAPDAGRATRFYRQMGRYSAAFALTSDIALLTLGGELKRKEMLSGRLGDILSELYFLSGALKRWEDEGRQDADFPLLRWCLESGFSTIEQRFDEVFANLPNRLAGWLLRIAVLPLGPRRRGPSDHVTRACADLLLEPSATRDRLVENVYVGGKDEAVGQLIDAFERVVATQPIHDRLRAQKIRDWKDGVEAGWVTPDEIAALEAADKAVAAVIAVDDFAHDGLAVKSQAAARPAVSAAKADGPEPRTPASDLGEQRTFSGVEL